LNKSHLSKSATIICIAITLLSIIFTANFASLVNAETNSYVTQWGTSGSAAGKFSYPVGIAMDSSGNVYVADSYNNKYKNSQTTEHTSPNGEPLAVETAISTVQKA
jgi:hypothetical protein